MFLQKIKAGVQRAQPFAGVWGVPTNFFLSFAAAGGESKR
jgi:hypothetical protein